MISGGTGLVGSHLSKRLKEKGFQVTLLSRTKKAGSRAFLWNVSKKEIENKAIDTADCIIHLAGENIGGKRWTKKRKQQIIDSRVKSGELIFEKVVERKKALAVFISASATGYYGAVTSEKVFAEQDPPAHDFLGETCRKWEETADKFNNIGIRTVKIRTGLVLTKQGGALQKMILPVKLGIASAFGSGNQYMPWIHIDDLCDIYIKAIEDVYMNGAYNAVSPEQITNREFMRTLAKVLNKPFFFPDISSLILKFMFGEMAAVLLKGSRVSVEKIKNTGYNFKFPELENALIDLTNK